jgi:hypothetical protein
MYSTNKILITLKPDKTNLSDRNKDEQILFKREIFSA